MLENKNIKKTNYNLNYRYLQPDEYDIKLKNPSESTSTKITQKPININTNNNYQEDNLVLSMIPGLGDAIDIIDISQDIKDKNYKSAGVKLGLIFIPNMIEKPIKAITKPIKKLARIKTESLSPSIEIQKDNIENAKNYIFEQWNKSKNFDKSIKNSSNRYELYLNPKIKNRAEKSLGKYKVPSYSSEEPIKYFTDFDLSYGIGNEDKVISIGNNLLDKNEVKRIFETHPSLGYYTDNTVVVRDVNKLIPNLKQQNAVAAHEFTHLMQDRYNINFDEDSPVYKLIHSSLNPTNKWAQNIDEIDAELWKYRKLHNIGSRDFTTEEIKDIIKSRPDLFHIKEIGNPSNNLIKGLKMLPAIIPGLVISNTLINNNKINNVDKKSRN